MNVTAVISPLWFLAMLAAVALSGAVRWRPGDMLAVLFAGAAVTGGALWLRAQPGGLGIVIGVIAVWRLVGGPSALADRLMCGACAGLAAALHAGHGVHPALAAGLSLAVLVAGRALVRPGPTLRGAGLALAGFVAPAAGLLPDVVAGWRNAETFNRAVGGPVRPIPTWALVWLGLALAAGLVRGLWVRR